MHGKMNSPLASIIPCCIMVYYNRHDVSSIWVWSDCSLDKENPMSAI